MALIKDIRQTDGVVTNYQRILYLKPIINSHESIAVVSYVDEIGRAMENNGDRPYRTAVTYEKEYEENMTIEDAYKYLKTLSEYEDAEDI